MSARIAIQKNAQEVVLTLYGMWDRNLSKDVLDMLAKSVALCRFKRVFIAIDSSFDLDFCGGEVLLNWLSALEILPESQNALLTHKKSKQIFGILQSGKETKDSIEFAEATFKHNKETRILKQWLHHIVLGFSFLGAILATLYFSVLNPSNFRIKALFFQIQESLIKAVPIIALACFLIGIVIAYQGSLQLQQFGASVLIVEMSAMLTLREMAPIIVAIIIAGRSASSFSAEIGMMRSTQEIDAMRVMGFNPITFLIFPRIFALVLALPLVVFIADMFGLIGSMLVAQVQLDISTQHFIERFLAEVEMRHFWIGILKAPFFGLIIALIGCFQGFNSQKDTRSIGVHTTKSVVESIFCVIAFDALCSVLFTKLGW